MNTQLYAAAAGGGHFDILIGYWRMIVRKKIK